jgi:cytochrome c oxidase assembly factor CtaG
MGPLLDPTLVVFLQSWDLEPTALAGLGLAAVLYAVGLGRIRRRSGPGTGIGAWPAAAFATGIAAVFLALQSPIATFSSVLFAMHMLQHLLLTLVGAPLLILGQPLLPLLWALPLPTRRSLARAFAPGTGLHATAERLTNPWVALVLHVGTVLAWHVPALYDAALRSTAIHYGQHATFFGTALLFWWAILQPIPGRHAMAHGRALVAIIAAIAVQEKGLGAILTFAETPLYRRYTEVPRLWGLTPLADQQLAGQVMMMGGFLFAVVAFTVIFFAWAAHDQRQAAREDALAAAAAGRAD